MYIQDVIGWGDNDRGVSYTFGRDIVRDFTSRHGISLICRAHQVVEDGYQFFEQRKVQCECCVYVLYIKPFISTTQCTALFLHHTCCSICVAFRPTPVNSCNIINSQ